MKKIIAALLLGLNLIIALNSFAEYRIPTFPKIDRSQCDRRCKEVFNADTGFRERFQKKEQCLCFSGWDYKGETDYYNPEYGIPSDDGVVCGANHKEYADKASAEEDGTRALHAGNCGSCSNTHDINIYKKTKDTLTETSKNCAIKQSLLGQGVGTNCLQKNVGFTPGCTDCWVQNMSCTVVHCGSICIKSKLHGEPSNINGHMNDCLACDEKYCGAMFIKCAGANRRRAGILSDIPRPNDQVWAPEKSTP